MDTNPFLIHIGQGQGRVEAESSSLLFLEVDIWFLLVQPDAHTLHLLGQDLLVDVLLTGVQHHDHQVSRPRYGNHLREAGGEEKGERK